MSDYRDEGEEIDVEDCDYSEDLYKKLNHYQKIAMLDLLLTRDANVEIIDDETGISYLMDSAFAEDIQRHEKPITVIVRVRDVAFTTYMNDDRHKWEEKPHLGTIGKKREVVG
jgi:uncharacterized protein with ATP-grasp and redox domains